MRQTTSKNSSRPRVRLLVGGLLAMLLVVFVANPALADNTGASYILHGTDGVDSYRSAAGVPAVTEDSYLDSLAQQRADQAVQDGTLQHNPDYWNYYLDGEGWGEVLATGLTYDQVATAWHNSGDHNSIMTAAGYNTVGVGYAVAPDGTTYTVGIFVTYQATNPSAPAAPTMTTNGDGSLQVGWAAPTNTGRSTISGYTAWLYTAGGTIVDSATTNSATTTARFGNLEAGTTYYATVVAQNQAGYASAESAHSPSVTTPAAQPDSPATPGLTRTSSSAVTATWTAPNTNGSPITAYSLTLTRDGVQYATVTTTNTAYTFTGLPQGSTYTVNVSAVNNVGASNLSAASAGVLLPVVVSISAPAAPTVPTVTKVADQAINVSWTAPGNTGGAPIGGYFLNVYRNGGFLENIPVGNTTSYTLTNLTDDNSGYTVAVAAENTGGYTGSYSAVSASIYLPYPIVTPPVTPPVVTATVPGAPTTPHLSVVDGNVIQASWNAPVSNDGAAVGGYTLTITGGGKTITRQSTTTTAMVTGLLPNTSYTVRVAAYNSVGTGASSGTSNTVSFVNISAKPATMSTPSFGTVKSTSINLKWKQPGTNGGYAIGQYRVEVQYKSGSSYRHLKYVTITDTKTLSSTVTSLKKLTTYRFRIQAYNTHGSAGSYSGYGVKKTAS